MFNVKKKILGSVVRIKILLMNLILDHLIKLNYNFPKIKLRRASPFVEEVGLLLIALFFFVILYSVFNEIIDSFISIIDDILQNLSF